MNLYLRQHRRSRRSVLGAAPLAMAAALDPPMSRVVAPADSSGMTATVALEGSGQFGPHTPGTRTSGIQEAIESVHAASGGTVHLRRGVYPITNVMPPPPDAARSGCGNCSLQLYDDITLRGEGLDQTVLRHVDQCNVNTILGWHTSRVCLEELTVDGGGLNQGYGIAIFGMGTEFADVLLRRVRAMNVSGSGYNPRGLLPQPALRASGAFVPNTHPFRVTAHLFAGTINRVSKRDLSAAEATVAQGGNVTVALEPGEAIAVEYSEPPAWTWFGA